MPIQKVDKIWMNGELVDWDDATIHVLTHTLHYGNGAFEGIRAYETDRGPAVFRLTPHIERLFRSAKILYIDVPWSVEDLVTAVKDTVRANDLPSCYIRPLVGSEMCIRDRWPAGRGVPTSATRASPPACG